MPGLAERAAYAKHALRDKLIDHQEYITRYGDDMPEIKDWTWGEATAAARGATSTAADNVNEPVSLAGVALAAEIAELDLGVVYHHVKVGRR